MKVRLLRNDMVNAIILKLHLLSLQEVNDTRSIDLVKVWDTLKKSEAGLCVGLLGELEEDQRESEGRKASRRPMKDARRRVEAKLGVGVGSTVWDGSGAFLCLAVYGFSVYVLITVLCVGS